MDVKAMSDLELARAAFYIHMTDSWSQKDRSELAILNAEMQLRGIRVNHFSTMELVGVK